MPLAIKRVLWLPSKDFILKRWKMHLCPIKIERSGSNLRPHRYLFRYQISEFSGREKKEEVVKRISYCKEVVDSRGFFLSAQRISEFYIFTFRIVAGKR